MRRSVTGIALLLTVLLLLAPADRASAVPLNLTLEPSPDIYSAFIGVTYLNATDSFTASGYALTLYDGTNHNITNGSFGIQATIDASGVASAGTLNIGGSVPDLGIGGPSLLTGSLNAFGFAPSAGSPLELLFLITGGDLAAHYGGVGAQAGVILAFSGFGGTFSADFGTSFDATADTAPPNAVPESTTLVLLAAGGTALALQRRWAMRLRA